MENLFTISKELSFLSQVRKEIRQLLELYDTVIKGHSSLIIVGGERQVGKTELLIQLNNLLAKKNIPSFLEEYSILSSSYNQLFSVINKINQFIPKDSFANFILSDGEESLSSFYSYTTLLTYFVTTINSLSFYKPPVILLADFYKHGRSAKELLWFLLSKEELFYPNSTFVNQSFMLVVEWDQLTSEEIEELNELEYVKVLNLKRLSLDEFKEFIKQDEVINRLYELTEGDITKLIYLITYGRNLTHSGFKGDLNDSSKSCEMLAVLSLLKGDFIDIDGLLSIVYDEEVLPEIDKTKVIEELTSTGIVNKREEKDRIEVAIKDKRVAEAFLLELPLEQKKKFSLKIGEYKKLNGDKIEDSLSYYLEAGYIPYDFEVINKIINELINNGELGKAIFILKKLLYFEKYQFFAKDRLVHCYKILGKYETGIKYLLKLLQELPDSVEYELELLKLYLSVGKLHEAESLITILDKKIKGSDPLYSKFLLLKGEFYYEKEDFKNIEVLVTELESINKVTYLELLNLKGKLLIQNSSYDNANEIFDTIIKLGKEWNIKEAVAKGYLNKGIVLLQSSFLTEAENYLKEAFKLSTEIKYQLGIVLCKENLGILNHLKGDYKEALKYYKEAIDGLYKIKNVRLTVGAITNICDLYLELGLYKRVAPLINFAFTLIEEHSLPLLRLKLLILKTKLLLYSEQLSLAEELIKESEKLLYNSSYTKKGYDLLLIKGEYFIKRENYKDSIICFKKVMASSKALVRQKAEAYRLMSHCVSNIPNKISYLLKAIEYYLENKKSIYLWKSALELTKLYDKLGEKEKGKNYLNLGIKEFSNLLRSIPSSLIEEFKESNRYYIELMEEGKQLHYNHKLKADLPSVQKELKFIVGHSQGIREVLDKVLKIAPLDTTVLITGESGTGKELIAEAIHKLSPRRDKILIKVNCAALVESLLLSELFGHEKGAFTGAIQRKLGRFELANGGTIFLDEIGDISPKTQITLLRVLQTKTFERVGGVTPIYSDVRVIAATNKDLERLVKEGQFRADLYFRLKGVEIHLPPLRERIDDIEPLIDYFIKKWIEEKGGKEKYFTHEALELLKRYPWPGNVRELKNLIEMLMVMVESSMITAQEIKKYYPAICEYEPSNSNIINKEPYMLLNIFGTTNITLRDLKKQIEKELILKALEEANWNITNASKLLGMTRPRLSQLVKSYNLKKGGRDKK